MKTEKIGNVTLYPSTHSPDDRDNPIDCTFTHQCDDDGLALVIRLDTQDESVAVARGRRIVQLWQEAEAVHAGDAPKSRCALLCHKAIRGLFGLADGGSVSEIKK